jgi:hypothetical protein
MNISFLKEKSISSTVSLKPENPRPIVTRGLVFIDPNISDYEQLIAGVKPDLDVVVIDDQVDGISQITQALISRRGLSSLHIVTHGAAGKLWLGDGLVSSSTLNQSREALQSWAAALAPDADILLYGCHVAAEDVGERFVQLLSLLTGANVAASNTLTGSVALGGNWELEVKIGQVETPLAFKAETMEAYNAVLPLLALPYRDSIGLPAKKAKN